MVDLVLNMFSRIGALFRHAPTIMPRPRILVRSVVRHGDVRNGMVSRHFSGDTVVSGDDSHSQFAMYVMIWDSFRASDNIGVQIQFCYSAIMLVINA